ncbi:hypothetical protein RRF68_03110 [Tenacibaculum sp. HL-MS23]|uniref:hypothetical protein n=1 Tax=Tenacibaculum sp. HL-MS23 TaxID=3077734 RepID=UPI0028FC0EEC|nr:hypothetical protein [Tenacibaculum sp. HL-MS23]WNW02430.1 hypothetical protein RRF68_03110 [Tenacibaculum sp. HL-MS23]
MQTDFEHNFGLDNSKKGAISGKMFGVLVVQNQQNEIGYITAVSGKLGEKNKHKKFVPPVYDMLTKDSFFLKEKETLRNISIELDRLENTAEYLKLRTLYEQETNKAADDITEKKKL